MTPALKALSRYTMRWLERFIRLDELSPMVRRRAKLLAMITLCASGATLIYVVALLTGHMYVTIRGELLIWAMVSGCAQLLVLLSIRSGKIQLAVQGLNLVTIFGLTATYMYIGELTPFMWFITLCGLLSFLIITPLQMFVLTSVCLASLFFAQDLFIGRTDEEFLRDELARLFVSVTLFSSLAYMKSRLFIHAEDKLRDNFEETGKALALAQQKREKAIALLDEARHLDEAKTLFLKGMNHELRTPLNAILGYTELIIEEVEELASGDDAEVTELFAEDARRIQTASRHLLSMLDEVLDIDKIETGGHDEMFCEAFDLAKLSLEVTDAMQHAASINGTQLTFASNEGEDFQVVLDPKWMRQILFNFLSNACKFTHSGRIEVTLCRQGPELVLGVKDSGKGMLAEDLEAIKQEYVQAKDQSIKEHGGTGLGLPLCYRLVEQMGGVLEMQSEPGKGTQVLVRFPWERVRAPEFGNEEAA